MENRSIDACINLKSVNNGLNDGIIYRKNAKVSFRIGVYIYVYTRPGILSTYVINIPQLIITLPGHQNG